MAHLFDNLLNKTRSKSPSDLVSKLVTSLERLTDSSTEKTQEDISKCLTGIKVPLAPAPCLFSQQSSQYLCNNALTPACHHRLPLAMAKPYEENSCIGSNTEVIS